METVVFGIRLYTFQFPSTKLLGTAIAWTPQVTLASGATALGSPKPSTLFRSTIRPP